MTGQKATLTKNPDGGDHCYDVLVNGQKIGSVQRFGSLPSMQRWGAVAHNPDRVEVARLEPTRRSAVAKLVEWWGPV